MKHLKDVKKQLCTLHGSWLKNLVIDGVSYWDAGEHTPIRHMPLYEEEGLVLDSDWRYREDLLWLKYNYQLIAHQWKVRLEVQ